MTLGTEHYPRLAKISLLIAVMLQTVAAGATQEGNAPLLLKNSQIEAGVLPRVGGRIVLLRKPGGPNVLLSDPALWEEPEEAIPTPETLNRDRYFFKPYNGHILWVGPESEWYNQQTFYPQKKGDNWPPDPFLIWGRYTVLEKTERRLVLQSPESPVSGVVFTKTIELAPTGEVRLKYTARNIRQTPVSWDLWSNTRVSPFASVYVPLRGKIRIETETGENFERQPLQYELVDRFFTIANRRPLAAPFTSTGGKAFLDVRAGFIAAFENGMCLIKRFPLVEDARLSKGQSNVEVYYNLDASKADSNLMELENHGPSETLPPGGTMEMNESLTVAEYTGEPTPAARIAFLSALGLGSESAAPAKP
jgi:hypothetical protein